ncbi:tryptophan synthase subunit alpha [Gammaproteobacteria bacterium]|nr:tryptophan synthase subunit alpha [Gammaproteobacteria bacterium]
MNRLTSTLSNLKANNQKALVAYLVAGDPDMDSTLDLMHLFVESGVDVIEIGVPFTDPIAEGPTIQRAHDRALKNNISLKMILSLVDEFRKSNKETPIVLMGYLNTFISHIELVQATGKDGIDSILVVDIPGELNLESYGISNPNINTISLISPTTKENRVELIANNSTGFIYYVNLRGVTGSSNLNISEIENNIGRIKKYTDLPTLAGFGIKTAEDAKTLAKFSDGIIIGSSIVEMINEASTIKEFDRIGKYIKDMKIAIS